MKAKGRKFDLRAHPGLHVGIAIHLARFTFFLSRCTLGRTTAMNDQAETETDRRHHRRTKIDVLVNRFLNGHPYMCRMTDISRTGARLIPIIEPKISPPPAFMGLQFQLPGQDEIITASGEAVVESNVDDGGRAVGVRFTNVPAQSAGIIEAFLNAA
jgi:hypothetical protein